jgi:hypothetical protein
VLLVARPHLKPAANYTLLAKAFIEADIDGHIGHRASPEI